MNCESPIIMLSGMGADARVFERQIESIPQMTVPEWIDPLPKESLASYAGRLADKINPDEPCFVGGASFGGFVALEMIKHLDVIACILVGSVRSPDEFPSRFKALRKMSGVADALPFEVGTLLSKAALMSSGSLSGAHLTELVKQMSESDASFLRWACRAVLEWEGVSTGDTIIYQIHGEKDSVLPSENTAPDVIIAGAGCPSVVRAVESKTRLSKCRAYLSHEKSIIVCRPAVARRSQRIGFFDSRMIASAMSSGLVLSRTIAFFSWMANALVPLACR